LPAPFRLQLHDQKQPDWGYVAELYRGSDEVQRMEVYPYTVQGPGDPGTSRDTQERRIQLEPKRTIPRTPPDGRVGIMLGFRDRYPTGTPARVLFVIPSFATWAGAVGRNSVQFRDEILVEAESVGAAAQLKRAGRHREKTGIVLAIVPELFPFFCIELAPIFQTPHVWTEDGAAAIVDACQRYLGALAGNVGDPAKEPTTRPKILRRILQPIRNRRFAEDVLEAYGYRCAICSIDLGLLDAAHIDPVENEGSSDEVDNGIALCPNHHRAFDRGLIDVDAYGVITVNKRKVRELVEDARATALEAFAFALPKNIRLPTRDIDHPNPENFARRAKYLKRSTS
jgi:hypothetical protein